MSRIRILVLAAALFWTAEAYKYQGCFEDLPSSFTFAREYLYQSSGECAKTCANSDFFALSEGNRCYCGSSASASGLLEEDVSNDCTMPCVGYPQEMCGGDDDAYSVYSMNDDLVLGNAGSSGSSSSSSSSRSSSSSTSRASSGTSTRESTSSSSPTTTSEASNSDESTSVQIYTSVVTNSGSDPVTSVVYVTSVSTPSGDSDGNSGSSGGGSNKSAIIGGAVGGVVGALIIFSLAFFFTWRRIHNNKSDLSSSSTIDAIYDEAKKRNPKLATNPFEDPDQEYTDHLMNPVALGRRRLSEGSLADEAEYSRKVLRVANPDDD